MDVNGFMRQTFALAQKGWGYTSPNPLVGAVVVKNGRIMGQGYHRKAGEAHAEVIALAAAGKKARGATLFVNLEPCCHYGRTAPCTEAILSAGVKKVVLSVIDPNPLVNGKGIRTLERHKVAVVTGVLEDAARQLNEVHFKFITTGLPFVIIKVAQSWDGRLATLTGDSQWISGEKARRFAHLLRSRVDAVLVGRDTVAADNPRLTVRLVKGNNPYRIVLDSVGRVLPQSRLVKENQDGKTIWTRAKNGQATIDAMKGVKIWELPAGENGWIDLPAFLRQAGREEITSLLVEGGSRVVTSFLRQQLADKIYFCFGPLILGEGKDTVGDLNVRRLSEGIRLREVGMRKLAQDILVWGYPAWPDGSSQPKNRPSEN